MLKKALLICILMSIFISYADAKDRDSSIGQIVVYLKGFYKPSLDITFNLTAMNLVAKNGEIIEIMNTPLKINSMAVAGNQILIAEKLLPTGKYKKIQFIIKEAEIKRQKEISNLALPSIIEVDVDITIRENKCSSLFLEWNPDASFIEGYFFKPFFTVRYETPQLSTTAIYVTNEESNNITVIDRHLDEVVATIMVGKNPRGIATSLSKEHVRVYVANAGSNSISVINPLINDVENEIPLKFGAKPEAITVSSAFYGKELIFVANYGSNTVSIFDASTYQQIEEINVGNGPIAIAADPPVDIISQSKFLSFEEVNLWKDYRKRYLNVYVANKNSKNVSILKFDILRNKVQEVINIEVGWSPVAFFLDYHRGKLYVANYDSDELSVIDILEIIKGNKASIKSITNIGVSISGVVSDDEFDRIYLLKNSEVLVIKPLSEISGLTKTIHALTIESVKVGKSPSSLIIDPEGRKLYVVNRDSNSVSVIDKTTRKQIKIIPVCKKPYYIAIFPF